MNPTRRTMHALVAMLAFVPVSGASFRAQGADDPPIQNIMERVQSGNRAIGRILRRSTALDAAGRKELAADAALLRRLGNEARALTGPAHVRDRSQADWTAAVDEFVRTADQFATVIADPRSSRSRAAESYQKLQQTCARCHGAFRE